MMSTAKTLNKPLILASASPWRRRLLKKHGISVHVHQSLFCERKRHAKPYQLALLNAMGKARSVARIYPRAIIIGVDTIGVLRGKILGKPKDEAHARRMLKSLSGSTHTVISGVCIIVMPGAQEVSKVVRTRVRFRHIHNNELDAYIESGHWKGKAGAYAIQGRAKGFVDRVRGDITNVVGLPIDALKKMLERVTRLGAGGMSGDRKLKIAN